MRGPLPPAPTDFVPLHETQTGPRHYYGNIVRTLFVVSALLIFATEFVGSSFLTPFTAILAAALLIVLAGLINPVLRWINIASGIIAGLGAITYGYVALAQYKSGEGFLSALPLLLLTVIFLTTLYFSVKTVRGMLMRHAPIIT